jgi:hypothetical protein
MQRRKFIQTIAALPAAAALPSFGQVQTTQRQGTAPVSAVGQVPQEGQAAPVLKTVSSVAAATPEPSFFSAAQLSALRRLSDMFMPAMDGKPGALDAGSAEFLDFYVGVSNLSHQQFYKSGLDGLNTQAKAKFGKTFADLSKTDADSIVKPMFKPRGPIQGSLGLGPFINRAYQDIWTVTVNSPAWAESARAAGLRVGTPLYWRKVDPTILLHPDAASKQAR